MIRKIFFFLSVCFFTLNIQFNNPLFSKEKPRVALLDFTPENTQATYARAVRNLFEVSLYKTEYFSILERNKMEIILKEQGLQMTGCVDTSCAVQIGKILSADTVIIGSLNKIGKFTITAKFINIAEGRIDLADSETAATEDDIQDAVKILARRMAEAIVNKTPVKETKPAPVDREPEKDSKQSSNIFSLALSGSYILPQGRFSNLADPGYGATVRFGIENILVQNLAFGIETGYWYMPGKKENVDYCTMVPGFVIAGYKFDISKSINMIISLSIGASYNIISYDKDGSITEVIYEKETEIESVSKAGLSLGYLLKDNFSIQLGMEYGIIFEEKQLGFLLLCVGADVKF